MTDRKSSMKAIWLLILVSALLVNSGAYALDINAVGPDGEDIGGYRWLIEEDVTYHVDPASPDPDPLAINFHKSYMPVFKTGDETNATGIVIDPAKHYYVSVLPSSGGSELGYAMGGGAVAPGQTTVDITVNKMPFPTAQISIFVFEDNKPINNTPNIPVERGLAGFKILLSEAGGRYGVSGGQVSQDAFGNPLGTTYNPDGSVAVMGSGIILTDANGQALIKYLPPAKYGISVVPPTGEGWVQTTTIEGTKVIDAWVKPGEPPFLTEFGPTLWHVFVGFVRPMNDTTVLTGSSTIQGQVVNNHLSRPPDFVFYNGVPFEHTTPWIGLNNLIAGAATQGLYAQRANADGTFSIPNVPPGLYQLVVWDDNLDIIIAFSTVTVNPDGTCATQSGSCDYGPVPVFNWFAGLHHYVFYDMNENGFWDAGEMGIPEQNINLRFRDGSLYQTMPTDRDGFVPFDETFPFFNWLVAEVDYARFKATGVTVVVDAGGPIDPNDPWSFGGLLNPQPQPSNGNLPYRTETGPVLVQAFQGFLGQTSVLMWGKKGYSAGENGGISGIIYYASTRAENDPRYAAADPWEPGIPRVQVNLYQDNLNNGTGLIGPDGLIDNINGTPGIQLADVDNYPFGNFPGPEDTDWNTNTVFDLGDAIQSVTSDSWDDNLPADCPGDPADAFYMGGRCYDAMRNWNQVRPGVFDGGYAFSGLTKGTYIVEAVPPPGYELLKEEDKNVDFGETFYPLLLPPVCVGDSRTIPAQLTLFAGVDAPFAGTDRPLCDRKQIVLVDGKNAAVDFFMFTQVPVSAHVTGMVLDDLANESNVLNPNFGEKFAPPFVPISIREWDRREISRVYSDQFGKYNALIPSTYSANLPMPSGFSPHMAITCLNDPGPIFSGGQWIIDPYYRSQYSQTCYTFQYMPGTTTYLDTPVIRVAAFAGSELYPLDCEFQDGTPRIYNATGPSGGPYVSATGQQITIDSVGSIAVSNPEYDGTNSTTVIRDYGFGAQGGNSKVTIGNTSLTINSWTSAQITATVPAGTQTGQLTVTRHDNGKSSVTGVTVTVGPVSGTVRHVPSGGNIQNVIDVANAGDLILVPTGKFEELLIMWKPVKLQGSGEGTIINAVKSPAEKLQAWRSKVELLISSGALSLLPGQTSGAGGAGPATTLATEDGPGVIVLGKASGGGQFASGNSRIDGFTIIGSDNGGGIIANGYAHYLEISNNRIMGNNGFYGGGIRIGHPLLTATPDAATYQGAFNDHIKIHHNNVAQNGGLGGAGGGISLGKGSDSYEVSRNFVCGNFSQGQGGGIGHLGLSPGGLIANNTIIFNQTFNQGLSVSGGGLFIGGNNPLGVALSEGTGNVRVLSNLIQGNNAGAGDGGGIRLNQVNGLDVAASGNISNWYSVEVFNNIIVDNVAALAGGGISLQDTAKSSIVHNTIANNDSTATAADAFSNNLNQSNPQPAGIVSRAHSDSLASAFGTGASLDPYRAYANPTLQNNIIRHNRSFYFLVDAGQTPAAYLLMPDIGGGDTPLYWDLAVLGTETPSFLGPKYCLLTDATGYDPSNTTGNPAFVSEYFNGARSSVVDPSVPSSMHPAPAFDEGGNFIEVQYGPLSLTGDYHITNASSAIAVGGSAILGTYPVLNTDYDGQVRPNGAGTTPDAGADEIPLPLAAPAGKAGKGKPGRVKNLGKER